MRFMLISKVVLGPVLLAQGRRVRRTALRLAEAAGERSGLVVIDSVQPELKLLFVGDSTMAGVGVKPAHRNPSVRLLTFSMGSLHQTSKIVR